MAMDAEKTRAEIQDARRGAEGNANRAGRQGSSWVDRIYDIIDERIGEAMKRLSE